MGKLVHSVWRLSLCKRKPVDIEKLVVPSIDAMFDVLSPSISFYI